MVNEVCPVRRLGLGVGRPKIVKIGRKLDSKKTAERSWGKYGWERPLS